MSMISLLVRMLCVVLDMPARSLPAISGAAIIAHMLKWLRYSVLLIPPLPISSMSGSFQAPGLAIEACAALMSRLRVMLFQLSPMSPVVRHRLPSAGPKVHGLSWPKVQML